MKRNWLLLEPVAKVWITALRAHKRKTSPAIEKRIPESVCAFKSQVKDSVYPSQPEGRQSLMAKSEYFTKGTMGETSNPLQNIHLSSIIVYRAVIQTFAIGSLLICFAPVVMSDQISEAVKKFNDKTLRFYLGFNQESLNAEAAFGQASPSEMEGKPEYRKGVFGKAFYLEKGRIVYLRPGNMPAANKPGTLCFWYCPVKWDLSSDNQPNNTLFRAHFPYSGINRTGFRKRNGRIRCRANLIYYIYRESNGKKENEGLTTYKDPFENDKWIFIALRWNKSKVILSVNASQPGGQSGLNKSRDYSLPMTVTEVRENSKIKPEFSFSMPEPAMLDEVMIFDRILSDKELGIIHRSYKSEP